MSGLRLTGQAARRAAEVYATRWDLLISAMFGVSLDCWQAHVLRSLGEGAPRVAIRSCHGPGKTATLAWAILAALLTRPGVKIPATAPTQRQLSDLLWAELARWIDSTPGMESIYHWTATRVALRGRERYSFATARVARVRAAGDTVDMAESLGGFHGPHVLVVCDEASGVPEAYFGALEGAMAQGERAQFIMAGNPTRPEGTFYRAFGANRGEWLRYHVDAYRSARVSNAWADAMVRRYGEEHPWVMVRVRGEFPERATDAAIPLVAVERGVETLAAAGPVDEFEGLRTLGVDVGHAGADTSSLVGMVGTLPAYSAEVPGFDVHDTAAAVFEAVLTFRPSVIVIDADGGWGSAVADIVARDVRAPRIVRWHGNGEPLLEPNVYGNRRAELWFRVRQALLDGSLGCWDDDRLAGELTTPRYTTGRGGAGKREKIYLEDKRRVRSRLGRSPDRADAYTMAASPVLLGVGRSAEGPPAATVPLHGLSGAPMV